MMHDEKAASFIENVVTTKTKREILELFGWDKSQDSDVFIKKLMAEWLWRSGVRIPPPQRRAGFFLDVKE